tara:strand:- start:24 stop:197 length:174 start_codon:yes stop_codon:yes gene_type:complete
MNILINSKPVIHKGYLQGYKVKINNKKYPLKKGFFYTSLNRSKCIEIALNEFQDGTK